MSALHLIRDGMITAAELLALLFIAPVGAAAATESTLLPTATQSALDRTGATHGPARRAQAERPLHLVDAALEMRLLGLLADVRVDADAAQRHAHRRSISATHLPAVDISVDSSR